MSLYLLHVPLGGALALPVATGLAGGAEQQRGQFVHPLRGGDGAGRRRRGRRCGAQPVIPPQHRPQHPRVLTRWPPSTSSSPPFFFAATPLDGTPWSPPLSRKLHVFVSRPLACLLFAPLGGTPPSSSRGSNLFFRPNFLPRYDGASCRDARCRRTEIVGRRRVTTPRCRWRRWRAIARSGCRSVSWYQVDTDFWRSTAAAEVWDFDRLRAKLIVCSAAWEVRGVTLSLFRDARRYLRALDIKNES